MLTFSLNAMSQIDSVFISVRDTVDYAETGKIPIFSLDLGDSDNELDNQDISGILQASRDVFAATAGFNFGQARFRIRGYGSENMFVLINGVPVNNPETGRAIWSTWGGLNDVTRFMEIRPMLTASRVHFGGVGGFSHIETRASNFFKGTRASYGISNRMFRHRIMITHASGMDKKGWAYAFSFSRRWAQEGYVEGTFMDAYAYFFSVEKKFNDKHTLGLTVFGAPNIQGRQGIAVQEAYDLAGTNFYNPNWGFQNGEKRNSRVSNMHIPVFNLIHYFTPNKKTSITTTLFTSFGRNGITGLNWFEARDPRPDFFRYLPSAFSDPEERARVENAWRTDVRTRQIDWDQMYFANSKNLYQVNNANGIEGNTVIANRSKYILEEIRNDQRTIGGSTILNKAVNEKLFLSGGINAYNYQSYNYRKIVDLLGGDFWLDIDQFAERDFEDPIVSQNNLAIPNRIVKEGDRYGFDYTNTLNKADAFAQAEFVLRKFEFYVGTNVTFTQFWRTGNVQNGRFPDNSLGDSPKQNYLNGGVKGGAVYKLTGRHYLSTNTAYITRAPFMRNAYVSPRTRDEIIDGITSEEIITGDLNYIIRYPKFRSRLTAYYTEINNQSQSRLFFHDEFRNFVNYNMTDINFLHTGLELGIDASLTSTIQLNAVATRGISVWNSRPNVSIAIDNSLELVEEGRTAYLKNFRIGGMPQTAASLGLRYNSPKYWFVGINLNYFADIYVDINPDRRTEKALEGFVVSDPQWSELIDQMKLPNQYTIDLFAGKSWRVKRKYFLNLNLNISNLTNNVNFATGGFEQLRYNPQNINRFPPRLSYLYGATYFLMLNWRY